MHSHFIDDVHFAPDPTELLETLRIGGRARMEADFTQMLAEAHSIARPKGYYVVAGIEEKTEQTVIIDGVTFSSRVLCVNLNEANRVFAFVASCGTELETWALTQADMLRSFWADAIQMTALEAANAAIKAHIQERYRPSGLSMMNPGSLADWPLSQQRPLFSLLGAGADATGVELTSSLMMSPTKSTSGFFFPLAESFESCQLCPMPNCPNRRAPYNATLYAEKYSVQSDK